MKLLSLALSLGLLLQAASPTIRLSETKQLKEYDFVPQAVGTGSAEVVFDRDVYVSFIQLTNTTGGALTVTVADRQGTPVHLLSAVSIAANTTFVIKMDPRWCPGGVTWLASGSGVTGYMRGLL